MMLQLPFKIYTEKIPCKIPDFTGDFQMGI